MKALLEESTKTRLNKDVLASHEKKYTELQGIMGKLEGKAQNLAAVTGGFIGAFYFIIRSLTPVTTTPEKILIVLVLLLLLITVIFCMNVVKTRKTALTPNGKVVDEFVTDLLALKEITEDHLNNYYHDKMRFWQNTIDKLEEPLKEKSKNQKRAQYSFFLSVFLMVLYTVTKLFIFTEAG